MQITQNAPQILPSAEMFPAWPWCPPESYNQEAHNVVTLRGDKDILHEPREQNAEPWSLLAEQCSLCDAAGVHGGERDTQLFVVAAVQLRDRQLFLEFRKKLE